MMMAIRSWGYSLCAAAVVCSLVQIVAPKTGTAKLLKLTASIFFLCCIFSPLLLELKLGDLELDIQESQNQSDEIAQILLDSMENQFQREASENVQAQMAPILEKLEVRPNKILISVNTSEGGSIFISDAKLILDESYRERQGEIVAAIESELLLKVDIEYE